MNRKVYINNCVLLQEGLDEMIVQDKNIDLISKMCIMSINKLLNETRDVNSNVPIFFGSAYSCLKSLHEFNKVCENLGSLRVNPSLFPNTVINSPSCRASIYHKITQPIYNISNGPSSGLDALGLAYMYIRNNEIDNAIVCVAEEDSEIARQIEGKQFSHSGAAIYLTNNHSDFELISYTKRKADTVDTNLDKQMYCKSVDAFYQINEWLVNDGSKNHIDIKTTSGSITTQIQLKKEG